MGRSKSIQLDIIDEWQMPSYKNAAFTSLSAEWYAIEEDMN